MKVWYNKVNESRRSVIDVDSAEITIGRDASNSVCLQSPLVSRRHVRVRLVNGKLHLDNIGLNSCIVGDEEVLGGQSAEFEPGTKVRIWPYSLTFETEKAAAVSREELEAHLRSIMAELELRIHRKLLEQLDLYEFETNQAGDTESIILLENNIEDVCRELRVFARIGQHQKLHHEFNIHHAAPVMFDVEQVTVIGMPVAHFLAHVHDLPAQRVRIALLAQHFVADGFELLTYVRIASTEAGPRQRLVLPYPGMLALIFRERGYRADQQPAGTIRTQAQVGFVQAARRCVAAQHGVDALRQPGVDFRCVGVRVVI